MIIDTHMINSASLKEQWISIDLSQILHDDQNLRIDQAKFQSDI